MDTLSGMDRNILNPLSVFAHFQVTPLGEFDEVHAHIFLIFGIVTICPSFPKFLQVDCIQCSA